MLFRSVVGPSVERATVRSVQVVGLGGRHATAVAVLSNGAVENETFELPESVSDVRLAAATSHLQVQLSGSALEAGAGVATTGDAELDSICSRALAALSGAKPDEQVYVGGASAMASAFDAVDTVRSVLRTLEQQYVLVSLVRDVIDRGLSVAIGVEHGDRKSTRLNSSH